MSICARRAPFTKNRGRVAKSPAIRLRQTQTGSKYRMIRDIHRLLVLALSNQSIELGRKVVGARAMHPSNQNPLGLARLQFQHSATHGVPLNLGTQPREARLPQCCDLVSAYRRSFVQPQYMK